VFSALCLLLLRRRPRRDDLRRISFSSRSTRKYIYFRIAACVDLDRVPQFATGAHGVGVPPIEEDGRKKKERAKLNFTAIPGAADKTPENNFFFGNNRNDFFFFPLCPLSLMT
jgi:hypothetical protein